VGTPPRKGELPPPVQGFGADPNRRAAANATYREELDRALADDADMQLDDERTQPHPVVPASSSSTRAMLEPVSEDAHPADQRRVPTHPELLSEALAAIAAGPRPSVTPYPAVPEPAMAASKRVPEPAIIGPNRSPSPIRIRVGLFSTDRLTNLLASAAIGLALTIIPAQKLARAHGQALLVQPLLELTDSIEHPLGVDAGLLRKPQAIAAEIEEVRDATRTRYLSIWLLAGLAIGLGLGFVPRWWA
jgi:hypothetical protein